MVGVEGLPVGEGFAVELGVELRGVEIVLDPQHLDRAGLGGGQYDGGGRGYEDGVVVGDEGLENRCHAGAQRVVRSGRRQGDLGGVDLFGVGAVDDGALVPGEGADAVAGSQEGEVGGDDAVEQGVELGFHATLSGGFPLLRGSGVEGRSAHYDAREGVQVEFGHGCRLEADAAQLALVEAGAGEEGFVLGIRGAVVVSGGEQDERLHGRTLAGAQARGRAVRQAGGAAGCGPADGDRRSVQDPPGSAQRTAQPV